MPYPWEEDEPYLRSRENVNVVGKMPPADYPYPENIDEIYLGTRTSKPTGTYTPPLTRPPQIDPRIQGQWNKLLEQYPYAQNFVNSIKIGGGEVPWAMGSYDPQGNVNIHPTVAGLPRLASETLRHEAMHGAQAQQYPPNMQIERNQTYYGPQGPDTPYQQRVGERLASAGADAPRRRIQLQEMERERQRLAEIEANRPWYEKLKNWGSSYAR